MSIINLTKKICKNMGTNNKSIYPVVAIATANGFFRPTITMLKKGENPESKKYAALREGITEIIAVPTYWISGIMAAKFGKIITAKSMDKHFIDKARHILSENVKNEIKSSAIKKGQTGLMFIGVCTAAGIIVPALCSLLVTPIMKNLKFQNSRENTNFNNPVQNKSSLIKQIPQRQFIKQSVFKTNFGMKVGGV